MAGVLLAGGCRGTPEHRLSFERESEDFQGVRYTDRALRRFELTNTGRRAVVIDSAELTRGHRGVLSLEEATTDCTPGRVMDVGQRCVVLVAFEPANDVVYRDSLHVDYRPVGAAAAAPLRARLQLRGTGVLDCAVTDALAASYADGVADAEVRVAEDIAAATAAGEGLTRDEGFTVGYDSAYARARALAYDGAYGDGLRDGYDDGYDEGASVEACRDGERDGRADGAGAGFLDGGDAGAVDGDLDGVERGYDDGFFDGETDGCGYEAKIDPDPSLPGKCVAQGHAATYSRSHYDRAFADAAATNAAYQQGLADGHTEGETSGRADGLAEGYADGYRDGADQGVVDGDADQYDACYERAFDLSYEDAYLDGYDASYETFYVVAYEEGYAAGYDDGYRVCS